MRSNEHLSTRKETPDELTEALGLYADRLAIVRGDVAEEQTSVEFTKAAVERCGRLDILPTQGAYAPSKGALHQMARQMAIEFAAHGIRVNTIECGTVDTPIVHQSAHIWPRTSPVSSWARL